jgi:hypothetical protein
MDVLCVRAENQRDMLTKGRTYEVLSVDARFYEIINDMGKECAYFKDRFEELYLTNLTEPTQHPTTKKQIAYANIVKLEEWQTTDNSTFAIERQAIEYQMILDREAIFSGLLLESGKRAPLHSMVTWARMFPDSLAILNELVQESTK